MATTSLLVKGCIEVGGGACASSCSSSAQDKRTLRLSLGSGACSSANYASIADTASPLTVATTGLPGQEFVAIDALAGLSDIQFLYVKSSADIVLRIGAAPATMLATGGTYPTGFVGAETFEFAIDGTTVSVVFEAADQTVTDVINRINAAVALAGLPTPAAYLDTATGQVAIDSYLTGEDGSVVIEPDAVIEFNSGVATIGFTVGDAVVGLGSDVQVKGLFMSEFTAGTVSRVEISGSANVSILAAGTSS